MAQGSKASYSIKKKRPLKDMEENASLVEKSAKRSTAKSSDLSSSKRGAKKSAQNRKQNESHPSH